MREDRKVIDIIDLIAEYAPLDIEQIIMLEVGFNKDTHNPILKIRYYNEKNEVKLYREEIKGE